MHAGRIGRANKTFSKWVSYHFKTDDFSHTLHPFSWSNNLYVVLSTYFTNPHFNGVVKRVYNIEPFIDYNAARTRP